jgi:hypothetical protein
MEKSEQGQQQCYYTAKHPYAITYYFEEAMCSLQNLHTSHILLSMWIQIYVLERRVL